MSLSLSVKPTPCDQTASRDGSASGRFDAETVFAGLIQNAAKTFASRTSAQDMITLEKTPRSDTSGHVDPRDGGNRSRPRDVRGEDGCRKNDRSHRGDSRDQGRRIDEEDPKKRDPSVRMDAMMEMVVTVPAPNRQPPLIVGGTAPSAAAVSSTNAAQGEGIAVRTPEMNQISQSIPVPDSGMEQKGASLAGMAAVMEEAELSIDLPPPSSGTRSPWAQRHTPDVNAAVVRVSVAEQKAPLTLTQMGGGGQMVAALAGMPEQSDSGAFEFDESQQNGGGNTPPPERDRTAAGGERAPGTVPYQNRSFFGSVTASVTALAGLTGSEATASVAATGASDPPAASVTEDATVSLRGGAGPLMRGAEAGMEGDERAAPAANADFTQTLRGSARGGAEQHAQPQRPIMTSSPDQVHVLVRKVFGEGAERITIQLRPAHLGRIDVRLDISQDGTVTAHVLADRIETLDMMARDARALEQALKDAGLQAGRDSLNFSLRGEERRQAEDDDHNTRHSGKNADQANEEERDELSASSSPGAVGLNADARLDIHV